MKYAHGFLDEVRARASLARYAESRVTFDARKSRPEKGEFWACCPFHQEKTPSFKINDREGLYYCFGCQASGNSFKFVEETENVPFSEAVRILAGQAGMPIREATPEQQEQVDEAARLVHANQVALAFYRAALKGPAGRAALDYLQRERGLDDSIIDRFQLGYAPDDRAALHAALEKGGVAEEDAINAGLVRRADDGTRNYDFFRNRIMFPLFGARGQCIAFGGRAMSDQARAKYLNSPETPIFRKSAVLYHFGPAREASRRKGRMLLAEGYMDVIALVRAGFEETAAPLGTALGEEHLDMVWNAVPRLLLALDGDDAGQRAAQRAVELAIPRVGPEREIQFALLPAGQDPDDLLKAEGPDAVRAVLESALPLVEMIWRHYVHPDDVRTPERAAELDARLEALAKRFSGRNLQFHYQSEFRARLRELRRSRNAESGIRLRSRPRATILTQASVPARSSALARPGADTGYGVRARAAVILRTLYNHPGLIDEFGEEVGCLDLGERGLENIKQELLSVAGDGQVAGERWAELGAQVETALRRAPRHVRIVAYAGPDASEAEAREGLRHILEEFRCNEGRRRELAAISEEICKPGAGAQVDERLRSAATEMDNLAARVADGQDLDARAAQAHERMRRILRDMGIWKEDQPLPRTGS